MTLEMTTRIQPSTGAPARSVRIVDVAKNYGATRAVSGINFDLAPGEFVTLLGPSGCGKSTTLNMIAGLDLPTEGKIIIGDRDVTTVKPSDRDIAMVFQSYALYPHLTVFENIGFPLRAKRRRLADADVQQKVMVAAGSLGLEKLLHRYPREVSGGQRQRVALGRAMVRTPALYLLDEPLSNLDQQLRVQMRSELKDLHIRLGATMLYVTHDQSEAMTLSDRIVVMSNGRIEQVGTPKELYHQPTNLFVAQFLGDPGMNIFVGELDDGRLQSIGVDLFAPPRIGSLASGISAGIRPEDLVVADPETARLKGTVRTVEFLGSRALLRADIGDTLVTAFLPAQLEFAPDQSIGLNPSSDDRVRWFDAQTGKAFDSQWLQPAM